MKNTIPRSLIAITIGVLLLVTEYQALRALKLQAENLRLLQANASPPDLKLTTTDEAGPINRATRKPDPLDESENERQARLRAGAYESIRQQKAAAELDGSNRPISYSLVEPGGKGLTTGAAKAAGLSKGEQQSVTEILRNTWMIVSDDFARRATFIEEDSSEEEGVSVYMVSARPDRGREFKEQLERELDAAVGEAKRNLLMKGVQRNDFFGGFGTFDVRIEFAVKEGNFKFALLNPLNGKPSCFGGGVFDEFKERFGESFELPPSKENPKRKW